MIGSSAPDGAVAALRISERSIAWVTDWVTTGAQKLPERAVGLLEPFVDRAEASSRNGFQYLTESGPIEWIISRSRSW